MKSSAKIILGYRCNNNCIFCFEKSNRHLPEKTTEEIKKEIKAARKKGKTDIHLIGGEPTVRQDIFEIISHAKKSGFSEIMITTNGRMLAYPDFAKKIVDSGLSNIVFSLHGHNEKVHDFITSSPGSFSQLRLGIKNLKKIGFENIGANVTITSQNYRHLPKIAGIFCQFEIPRVEFIYVVAPTEKEFIKLTPQVQRSAPYIIKALEKGKRKGYCWKLLNPPIGCPFTNLFKNHINYGDSRNEQLFISSKNAKRIHEASRKKVIDYARDQKCSGCRIAGECLGIWKTYLKNYGNREIKTIK